MNPSQTSEGAQARNPSARISPAIGLVPPANWIQAGFPLVVVGTDVVVVVREVFTSNHKLKPFGFSKRTVVCLFIEADNQE